MHMRSSKNDVLKDFLYKGYSYLTEKTQCNFMKVNQRLSSKEKYFVLLVRGSCLICFMMCDFDSSSDWQHMVYNLMIYGDFTTVKMRVVLL
jgi:hypothetical protein